MSDLEKKDFIEITVKELINLHMKRAVNKMIAMGGITIFIIIFTAVSFIVSKSSQVDNNTKNITRSLDDIELLKKQKADLDFVKQTISEIRISQKEGYDQILDNQKTQLDNQNSKLY